MKTSTKQDIVKNISNLYSNSEYAIIVDYKGMNAETISSFRGDLRKQDGLKFIVIKNTLNKKGAEGTEFLSNLATLKGQCGVVFCNDLLKASKVIDKYCFKEKKANFISCIKKSDVCSEEMIKELATLPSMEVLRTKLLYLLNSKPTSLVMLLNEVAKNGRDGVKSGE